ncbi:13415_t:CDS:2, partial [Ambispora gerdemannii]
MDLISNSKNQNIGLLNTFAQDFTELMKDDSLYDLKIILPNGKTILSHKFCIIIRSAKFRKIIQESNIITEATNPKSSHVKVKSPKIPRSQLMEEISLKKIVGSTFLSDKAVSNAFEELFFYFYHDTLNAGNWDVIMANRENFLAFIQLIKVLEMRHLVEPTLEKIKAYLSSNNAVDLLNGIMKLIDHLIENEENSVAYFYGEAAQKCIEFFKSMNALVETNFRAFSMGNLSLESFNYLMENIYVKDRNNYQETNKFLLVINWFNSTKSDTAAKTQDLFQHIEFPLIQTVTLTTKISDIKRISPKRYQDVLDAVVIQLAKKCAEIESLQDQLKTQYEQI